MRRDGSRRTLPSCRRTLAQPEICPNAAPISLHSHLETAHTANSA
jgi:hypothetical protein